MFHKDCPPGETNARIKSVFEGIGVSQVRAQWSRVGTHLYSVRLTCGEGDLGANGKGLSRQMAWASAGAEWLERIQNRALWPGLHWLAPRIAAWSKRQDFVFSPDEAFLTSAGVIDSLGPDILSRYAPLDADLKIPEEWLEPYAENGRLLCLPFLDLRSGRKYPLPLQLIRFHLGTTGMCAGNNFHEAMLQGLSEIAERHAQHEIFHRHLRPPEISRRRILIQPLLRSIVEELEQGGRYALAFRDGSLGQGLPVVAAVLFDRETQSYHVNFGAHPDLHEATARSLTEMFQGRTLMEIREGPAIDFGSGSNTYALPMTGWSQNYLHILKHNSGNYPADFFLGKGRCPDSTWKWPGTFNNQKAYGYLWRKFEALTGGPVLIRDASYLDFPTFHVVVPGMNYRPHTLNELRQWGRRRHIADHLINLDQKSPRELQRIREHLESFGPNLEGTLADWTFLPFRESSQWKRTHVLVFMARLCLILGDRHAALRYAEDFLHRLSRAPHQYEAGARLFFSALRDYLGLLVQHHLKPADIRRTLGQCYRRNVLEGVENELKISREPFRLLKIPRCFRCQDCHNRGECDFEQWQVIDAHLRGHEIKRSR